MGVSVSTSSASSFSIISLGTAGELYSCNASIKQIQEMDKFSNDVYREILSDSPDIAIANTTMRKHTEPMKQELMNLVALKKMLDECIVKEGEKLNGEEKEF